MDAAQFPPLQTKITDDSQTWQLPGPSKEGGLGQWREDIGETDLENLWFLCGGAGEDQGGARGEGPNTAIRMFREQQYGDFDSLKHSLQETLKDQPEQPEIIVLILQSDTLNDMISSANGASGDKLGIDLRALGIQSYHSSISETDDERMLEMRYTASQANKRSKSEPSAGGMTRIQKGLTRHPNLIFFRHNIMTERTICAFAERDRTSSRLGRERATIESFEGFARLTASHGTWLHPFSVHLIILYHIVWTRKILLDRMLDDLLNIEKLLLDGSLIAMKSTIEDFKGQIQTLHEISRSLITLEHSNENDITNIDNLLRDIARLGAEEKAILTDRQRSQERIKDGFLCLRSTCLERTRKIANRKQRAHNLISLLYNLTANRDSSITIDIAQQNASIAQAARRDSISMSVIATLTMIFLPATLVCGLFGTNFFALDTEKAQTRFVVSELWWIYPVATLFLTALTISIWLCWKRYRVKPVEEFDV